MKKSYVLLFSAIILLLAACNSNNQENTDGDKSQLEKVSFALDWTPNTNHTGIYVAKEKGYFEDEGLDVDIVLPGEVNTGQLISTRKADFGISYQESLMMARNEGLPLVSVTAIMQHNTAGYASPTEKNITSPADLEGKIYGANMSELSKAIMKTLMEESGADYKSVESKNIGDSDFFVAIERDIDFSLVFQGWTGIEAEIRDVDLNMIFLNDYAEALDFYTPIIATSEALIDENPELVEKFIRAAVKGYEFAINEPAEAAQIVIDSVPDINAELVERSQEWISTKYQDDASQFGIQEKERWELVRDFMIEHDLIESDFNIDQAFTNDYLPKE